MESLKRNWYLVLIILATVALGLIAVFTAVKLYKVGKKPVAPTAPLPVPAVEVTPTVTPPPPSSPCTLNFCISAPSPTVTPTPSITPPTTPTPTSGPTTTPTPPTPTPTATPAPQATPTPTVYVAEVELPEAGFTLPTAGVVIGGIIFVVISLLLAL